MSKRAFYLINAITLYRLFAAPLLVGLALADMYDAFKWLLPVSFFTDMIDGHLARKHKVVSILGSKLDSVSDDLTVIAAVVGLFKWKMDFIYEQKIIVITLICLLIIQNGLALIKYKKTTSFHTILAKVAALLQGTFLVLMFIMPEPPYFVFYFAVLMSVLDLVEEIIMVIMIPKWTTDVKGIYWAIKNKNTSLP